MPSAFRPQRRSGLTLVEILIALTMTLIVLGTMMTAFRYASEEMKTGRALIELANRARIVEDHLRTDLGSLTVETKVHNGTVEPHGYFEYIEGANRDSTLAMFDAGQDGYQGDCDDVLAFTSRSTDGILYRGRQKTATIANGTMTLGNTNILESSLAEIVWFTTVNDNDPGRGPLSQQIDPSTSTGPDDLVDFDDSIRIHRRVLLIRPDLGTLVTNLSSVAVNNFIRNNDISVRVVPNGSNFDIIANGLDDLAVRSNRFAHNRNPGSPNGGFPNNLTFTNLQNRIASDDDQSINYQVAGQTWQALPPILSDVCAFDLRAYSPTAGVNNVASVIVEPSDFGYDDTPANLQPLGAYVDLGFDSSNAASRPTEWFIGSSTRPTNPVSVWNGNVWDTWTPAYESDGINQDGDRDSNNNQLVDESTNGVDDGGSNVIDDPGERETTPPYLEPIRGMKVVLRLVEKGTKQVHQVSIIHSFVPE